MMSWTDTRTKSRGLGIACGLLTIAPLLAAAPSAQAATGVWGCQASAAQVTVGTNAPLAPLVANQVGDHCMPDSVGVGSLGASLGNVLGGGAASAVTAINTTLASASQNPAAASSVADVSLPGNANPILRVGGTVSSAVTAVCNHGVPSFSSTGTTAPIYIAGKEIPTNQPVTEVLTGVGNLTGAVLTVVPGQVTKTATSVSRTGLHVNLHLGSASLVDATLATAKVSSTGGPCVATVSGDTGSKGSGRRGSGTSGTSGSGSSTGSSAANAAATKALLAELRAGSDQFGARVESTRMIFGGKRTRIRIGCWSHHKGNCNIRVAVFRLPSHKVIATRRITVRPGHIKVIVLSTPRFARYPVFVHLMA